MSLGLKLKCPLFFQNLNLISHSKTKSFRQFDLSLRYVLGVCSSVWIVSQFILHSSAISFCSSFELGSWAHFMSQFTVGVWSFWCLYFRSRGDWTITLLPSLCMTLWGVLWNVVMNLSVLSCLTSTWSPSMSDVLALRLLSVYFWLYFFALRPFPEFPWVLQCLVTFLLCSSEREVLPVVECVTDL